MDQFTSQFNNYTGYSERDQPAEDAELTHVGPNTPCGEYLRQYWHGIALSKELGELPLEIRILGEDLVLFRTGNKEVGLVHRHCAHRGASLRFGRIEDDGIRCCYHGWKWSIDGTLLDAGAESKSSPVYSKVRQGAYPAFEYKGIIFGYFGPPKSVPEFPVYDTFEIPDTEMVPYTCSFPCNWLQVTENGVDPVHSMFLHTLVNGPQFYEAWGVLGDVDYFENDLSIYCTISRRINDNIWMRVQENILPNVTQSGAVHTADGKQTRYFGRNTFFRWCVPVDDTHTKVVAWANFGPRTDPIEWNSPENIETLEQGELFDRPPDELQRNPGDYEAMVGQGPIVVHAKENRVTSDKGVAMFRNRLRKDIRAFQQGQKSLQPGQLGPMPIPTWSGDTVLQIPLKDGIDDKAMRAKMFESLKVILTEAQSLRGDDRDRVIIQRLKTLEAET